MPVSEARDLRAEILTASTYLFIAQGYHGLSMRQIAEAVGVSKAALYYHFRDKEELFLAMLDSYLGEIEALLDRLIAEEISARESIREFIRCVLAQPAEQRAIIRLFSQEMSQLEDASRQAFQRAYHQKFLYKVQRLLQFGIERGELRPMDATIATWTLLGIMYPYFYPAHTLDMPSPDDLAEQIAMIYLDGVGGAKA